MYVYKHYAAVTAAAVTVRMNRLFHVYISIYMPSTVYE